MKRKGQFVKQSTKLMPLDRLFSEFIRKRAMKNVGGCERCLHIKKSWEELQTSHFHGRSKKSVRWDEDNAVGLCGACHMYFTVHPLEHTEWFKARLGDEFDMLNSRMREIGMPDIEMLELYYTTKLRELG